VIVDKIEIVASAPKLIEERLAQMIFDLDVDVHPDFLFENTAETL